MNNNNLVDNNSSKIIEGLIEGFSFNCPTYTPYPVDDIPVCTVTTPSPVLTMPPMITTCAPIQNPDYVPITTTTPTLKPYSPSTSPTIPMITTPPTDNTSSNNKMSGFEKQAMLNPSLARMPEE